MEDKNLTTLKATIEGNAKEWHRRLDHLNFQSLQMLSGKEMVYGRPKLKEVNGV